MQTSSVAIIFGLWVGLISGCGLSHTTPENFARPSVVIGFPQQLPPDAYTEPGFSGDTEALEQYNRQMLSVQSGLILEHDRHSMFNSLNQPTLGHLRQPIEWPEFYERAGRPDLAKSFQRRNQLRWGLMLGGGAMGLAALAVGVSDLAAASSCSVFDENFESCSKMSHIGLIGGLALGGLTACIIAVVIDPQPVSMTQASRLAIEHNDQLKQKLNLKTNHSRADENLQSTIQYSFGPQVHEQGAGLAFKIRY